MVTKIGRYTKPKRVSPLTLRRMKKARKDYSKLWEEVEPFVRKRKVSVPSTVGKWLSFDYEF